MNLCLLIPVRRIFQIYDEGTRAKAQLICYVVTILSFPDSHFLKFEVKDREIIRNGYEIGMKNGCFVKPYLSAESFLKSFNVPAKA